MKPIPSRSAARRQAGILLVECLVYMSVFVIILGGAMTAFYFCWDNSKALIYTSDDVSRVLQVGEGWRADVRAATGRITVETTADGDRVVIPAGNKQIVYRVAAGEMRREVPSTTDTRVLLTRVQTSSMKPAGRGAVDAWRWDVSLSARRNQVHLTLQFTFEAVPPQP